MNLICQAENLRSIEIQEHALELRLNTLGDVGTLVIDSARTLIEIYNKTAMQCVGLLGSSDSRRQQTNEEIAIELLKKADTMTGKLSIVPKNGGRAKLRAITLNNFGVLYQSIGKPRAALKFLDKALRIENYAADCDNPAGTHLNLCAILSQLNEHQQAKSHAECALELIRAGVGVDGKDSSKTGSQHEYSTLAIAHYNLAVEQEHLKMMEDAIINYSDACEIAEKQLGSKHPQAIAMKKGLKAAIKSSRGQSSPRSPRSKVKDSKVQ